MTNNIENELLPNFLFFLRFEPALQSDGEVFDGPSVPRRCLLQLQEKIVICLFIYLYVMYNSGT